MHRPGRSPQSCGNARFSAARPPARGFRRSRKRARDYPVAQRRIASGRNLALCASGLILHGRGRVHKKKRAQTPSGHQLFRACFGLRPIIAIVCAGTRQNCAHVPCGTLREKRASRYTPTPSQALGVTYLGGSTTKLRTGSGGSGLLVGLCCGRCLAAALRFRRVCGRFANDFGGQ